MAFWALCSLTDAANAKTSSAGSSVGSTLALTLLLSVAGAIAASLTWTIVETEKNPKTSIYMPLKFQSYIG